MTPMIDVVFLLIIFFLVASHLQDQDSQIEIELPDAASGVPQQNSDQNRITINIPTDGKIIISGRQYSNSELKPYFEELKRNHGESVEVRIRGNRAVPYKTISPILKSCAEAGIWNLTFAVHGKVDRWKKSLNIETATGNWRSK